MFKSIFQMKYFIQRCSVRCFCQNTRICWNCQHESSDIFCSHCKKIQQPAKSNYFEIFQLNQQFDIDLNDLTKKFRNLQSSIHPDKFSGRSEKEQEISAEWSSLVNKAYKVLNTSLNRGEYLLQLHGTSIPEQNTISDPEFLMEMMERNEQAENASSNELEQLLSDIRDEMTDLSAKFALSLQSGNIDEAKTHLIKIKYLASIENSIKEKISC